MASMGSSFLAPPPALRRLTLQLPLSDTGAARNVRVTTWGTPVDKAKHTLFYFGGMPCSASEPPLHSLCFNKEDLYAERQIHLVCVDRPGIGGTALDFGYRIRKDWPRIVAAVADELGVDRYGVFGMSNGGPYVMACLTAQSDDVRKRVKAAANVVGVSDVSASGYFSCSHPSGMFEGVFNSLPIVVAGPLIWVAAKVTSCLLFCCGFYRRALNSGGMGDSALASPEAQALCHTVLSEAMANVGTGAALDCQLGLSPLYARPRHGAASPAPGAELSAVDAYRAVDVPVALWYGLQDSTVPISTADWLAEQLGANGTLVTKHYMPDSGHGLYFTHAEEVLDDLLAKLDLPQPDPAEPKPASPPSPVADKERDF